MKEEKFPKCSKIDGIYQDPTIADIMMLNRGDKFFACGHSWRLSDTMTGAGREWAICKPLTCENSVYDSWDVSKKWVKDEYAVGCCSKNTGQLQGMSIQPEQTFEQCVKNLTGLSMQMFAPFLHADPKGVMDMLLSYCRDMKILAYVPNDINKIHDILRAMDKGAVVVDLWTEEMVHDAVGKHFSKEAVRDAMSQLTIDNDYGVTHESFYSLVFDCETEIKRKMQQQRDNGNCPDCGRIKAKTANDIMDGCCPKWYAVMDDAAFKDCRKFEADWGKAATGSVHKCKRATLYEGEASGEKTDMPG